MVAPASDNSRHGRCAVATLSKEKSGGMAAATASLVAGNDDCFFDAKTPSMLLGGLLPLPLLHVA